MKKTLFLALFSIALVASSCKSTSHSNCDAYGYTEQSEEFDIHKISAEQNGKYVTTTSLK